MVGICGDEMASRHPVDMNVDKVWGYYRDSTQKTSELVRQLAYAGFAVVWILKPADGESLASRVVLAALFLVVTLMLDISQHVVACYKLRALAKKKEGECRREIEGIESEGECQRIWKECTGREFELPKNVRKLAP